MADEKVVEAVEKSYRYNPTSTKVLNDHNVLKVGVGKTAKSEAEVV